MKILVINFEYPPVGGGASPVGEEVAIQLYMMGNQVDVITMAYGLLPQYEERNGIKIHRIESGRKLPNMSRLVEHLKFLYGARKFLKTHLKNNNYDVVHAHFFISSGVLAYWLWKYHKIPYIITPHGSDLPGYNPDHFKWMHLFTPRLIRLLILNCQFVISPSKYLGNLVIPLLKNDNDKLKIIPYGITLPEPSPQDKKNIILSTGRLLRRKGFHWLIEAVSSIDIGYELHIAGDGPMMSELKELASRSKTRVVLHGWLDNKSKKYHDLLRKAKIYSLVSSSENVPVSLLEAMSYNCAVITSDETGCAELVADAGVLIPANNLEVLKSTISDLVQDEDRIIELGKRAQKRVKDHYVWSKVGLSYKEVLEEACQK